MPAAGRAWTSDALRFARGTVRELFGLAVDGLDVDRLDAEGGA